MQLMHLAIKPTNIIMMTDGTYRLTDAVFNDYVIGWLNKEDAKREQQKLAIYPHLDGKTEHTLLIFNKTSNEYLNTKNYSKSAK